MPKKAKSKQRSKPKLNIKKSKKGRRAAPPKRRKVAVSIPALEAAATKAADFAAKQQFLARFPIGHETSQVDDARPPGIQVISADAARCIVDIINTHRSLQEFARSVGTPRGLL